MTGKHWMLALLIAAGGACDNENNEALNVSTPPLSGKVSQQNLVSDQPGAAVGDATLVNAWGLAFNPAGVAWVSANGSGISEVYSAAGAHVIRSVTIPGAAGMTSAPTGQVFNSNAQLFMGDAFIFVTEDGVISGWQQASGSSATVRVDRSGAGAVYKGVALAAGSNGVTMLFAANFHAGTVEVYNSGYQAIATSGGFVDSQLPAGYAPFNVANVQGALLVTYALQDQDKKDDVSGPGHGFVDLFDGDGNLHQRLISGGELNSPWGVALAPPTFDAAPNRLLIGNFGDGAIHTYVFDLYTSNNATAAGALTDGNGTPIAIDGLWALAFPPAAGGFDASHLYFTAGPADESHGLFGKLVSTTGTAPGMTPTTPTPITPTPTTPGYPQKRAHRQPSTHLRYSAEGKKFE